MTEQLFISAYIACFSITYSVDKLGLVTPGVKPLY